MLPVLLHNRNFTASEQRVANPLGAQAKSLCSVARCLHALVLAATLNKFNLVPFRCVDEGDLTAAAGMRPVGQGITFCSSVLRERIQIIHFKGKMGQIGPNNYRPAFVKFANLNFLITTGRLEKYELRPTTRGLAADLLEPEDIFIEGDRFLQIVHAIARVQEFLDHVLCY